MTGSSLWPKFIVWWHGLCIGFCLGVSAAVLVIKPEGPWVFWVFIGMPLCGVVATMPRAITGAIDGVRRFRAAAK